MNMTYSPTLHNWLTISEKKLKDLGIKSARLDSLIILEIVLNISRANILAKLNEPLSNKNLDELNTLLLKRSHYIPMAYLTNKVEFYKRDFFVNENVLIPRPETEAMIDSVKEINPKKYKVLDLGTGSGIIGITLKLEIPSLDIDLSDISQKSLVIAKKNYVKFKLNLHLIHSDLLDDISSSYDLIVANLPYVPINLKIEKDLDYEPKRALFSGQDGLDLYRKFWHQISQLDKKPKFIFTESLIVQHKELTAIAKASGYSLYNTSGLIQSFSLKVRSL